MNYQEFSKLYPEFKIPCQDYAKYYVDTLCQLNICDSSKVQLLKDFEQLGFDFYKYKKDTLDEILDYLRQFDFTSLPPEKLINDYELIDFGNYKPNKFYVSIDLSEANWQSFKFAFDLQLPKWSEWVEKEFLIHPLFSESKSLRQLIFGNTNPKKIQIIQKVLMTKITSILHSEIKGHIVGRSSDELILEFNEFPAIHTFYFGSLKRNSNVDCKVSYFKMDFINSFDEIIKIKTTLSTKNTIISNSLVAVPGNRYFIHLKNFRNLPITKEDLTFFLDKKKAQWIL
jgi:hypothetical protein